MKKQIKEILQKTAKRFGDLSWYKFEIHFGNREPFITELGSEILLGNKVLVIEDNKGQTTIFQYADIKGFRRKPFTELCRPRAEVIAAKRLQPE